MSPAIGESSVVSATATRPEHEKGETQTPEEIPEETSTSQDAQDPDSIARRRKRATTSAEEIENTIIHPGSVRINVEGAFIVDPGSSSPSRSSSNGSGCATSDIRLPNHHAVVSHIAVDIGGSLIKLVYFSREAHSREPGGRLNFINFETDHIDDCLEFMRHIKDKQQRLNGSQPGALCVMATGGGAYKFYDKIRDVLGVDVIREDEMECLIIGLDFFITEIPREVFTYSETDPMHFESPSDDIYPYLLVNIGSGVSMLKVSGPRQFDRVGGTSLGGGTLWGLLSLLTGARSFDEMLDAAERGDNTKVDMLVGDIYGTDYGKIGLKSTTIASSFGKVFRMKREAESAAEDNGGLRNTDDQHRREREREQEQKQNHHPHHHHHHPLHRQHHDNPDQNGEISAEGNLTVPSPPETDPAATASSSCDGGEEPPFTAADISRSLLYAISNNIGQIAFLQSQIHNLSHIYFGGSFIRGHRQTINTLSYAIKFWSQGRKQAYFLRHEGYLGSVGAFLKRQPRNWGRRGSFEAAASVPRPEGGALSGLEARLRQRAEGGKSASSPSPSPSSSSYPHDHNPEMQSLVEDYAEDSGTGM
ncbi:fumble-domain-containing protein [Sodiomyces alkalinus F11]|uniref:Fumble-domain-containing protein n=1 Tax=Sodiomyces alkalinus (strain CBS 110278 / VKM F-3762 / F11) TaxID=1314773 RepID=A0A3N2PJJ8_SODAK|nr:fumble-domain-containing protein [Sodiomyces alkalinus F11]ROT34702.1 fumble-domain-containing protein [Sodiomyces alkalinus F11]